MGVEYLVCPLCGLNRVVRSSKRLEKGKQEVIRFNAGRLPSLETMRMLQIREGGGKQPGYSGRKGRGQAPGAGFRIVEGKTLKELMENEEYSEILLDLKTQFLRVLNDFMAMGFITRSEI